ncbi:hypothetical protein [Nitrospira sp. KM1]|uniref:hypothetical protein n=1 Tax=Nitrospira sp. KM1 TaxID=1936990 RepID=UPI00156425A3|nr:hypothetical protein [Nitrospira sp. KM1]
MNPALLMLAFLLMPVACSHFDKSELSGAKKGVVSLVMIPETDITHARANDLVMTQLMKDRNFETVLTSSCLTDRDGLQPVSTPMVNAGGQESFEYPEAELPAQEQLRRSGQASYSARAILADSRLQDYRCALVVRGPKYRASEFVALIRFNHLTENAFQIQPAYIRLAKSVAVTVETPPKPPDNEATVSKPSIDVSVAVAIKSLEQHTSGMLGLTETGGGVFTVHGVELGDLIKVSNKPDQLWFGKAYTCQPERDTPREKYHCPSSDLIPYPSQPHPLSISISITETGNVGVGFDQTAAESRAIKEAIGPVTKETGVAGR